MIFYEHEVVGLCGEQAKFPTDDKIGKKLVVSAYFFGYIKVGFNRTNVGLKYFCRSERLQNS